MASYVLIESRNILGEVAFCHDLARRLLSAGNRDTRFRCRTASCRRERKPLRRNSPSSPRPGLKFSPTTSCCDSEEFLPIMFEPPRSGARAGRSAIGAASGAKLGAAVRGFRMIIPFLQFFGSALPASDSAVRGFPSSFRRSERNERRATRARVTFFAHV